MLAGTVAFNWAFENQKIEVNAAQGLRKFSGQGAKRDVLTDTQVKKLFGRKWTDDRAKLGNMIAASTGLRFGEIVALQLRDIGDTVLHVRHSWSEKDRLKSTKTNTERAVPLLKGLRSRLLGLAAQNPHGAREDSFVFWSTVREDTPCDRKLFTDHLRKHLRAMRIPVGRKIDFHSWRHYYSARMADVLDERKVMLATGHKNSAVFETYADHRNEEALKIVGETTEQVFSGLLSA